MNALAVIALAKRLRTLIARGSHRSELLETCDLLDVAIEAPAPATDLAPPPASDAEQTPRAASSAALEAASQPDSAGAGGGACALPPGWHETPDNMLYYGTEYLRAACVWMYQGQWYWLPRSDRKQQAYPPAPTMLQAMAAALGLTLRDSGDGFLVCTLVGPDVLWAPVTVLDRLTDRESCARAALERYHARQQLERQSPPPAPDTQAVERAALAGECKCWTLPGGKRQVNRWCALHAAEWQTYAEQQAAAMHPDGSPRAGCEVCGSPELDPRERGLR